MFSDFGFGGFFALGFGFGGFFTFGFGFGGFLAFGFGIGTASEDNFCAEKALVSDFAETCGFSGNGWCGGFSWATDTSFGIGFSCSVAICTSKTSAGAIVGGDEGKTPNHANRKTAMCSVADMAAAVRIPMHYFFKFFVSGILASKDTLRKPAALNSPITPIIVP